MQNIIKSATNFKIIPCNYKSSGAFNIVNYNDDCFDAKLELIEDAEIADYVIGQTVEVFAVYEVGLIYFETKILEVDNDIIKLSMPQDYSIIQRREYSRVGLNQGNILFKDLSPEFVQKVVDISAGGAKIIANEPIECDKNYSIEVILSNNMKINCSYQPIRIIKEETENNKWIISGKFNDLDNVDRVVLVQYAFKIKMEEQNKENQ